RKERRLHAARAQARERRGAKHEGHGGRHLTMANGGSFKRELELVADLALSDYRHEWVISGCAILALSAVLIPLLVLFGLKYGIITNLLDPLIQNPRYREVAPIGSGNYGPEWFTSMRE